MVRNFKKSLQAAEYLKIIQMSIYKSEKYKWEKGERDS